MLKRALSKIVHPNPVLSFFGVFIGLVSAIQVIDLILSDPRWDNLASVPKLDFAGLVGLVFVALLIARSLISDFWNVFKRERRIVCGSGQSGTSYDYRGLLSRDPREVVVVVQNMRTLLTDGDYLPSISKWLSRNKERGPKLTFILSTPKALGAIGPNVRDGLKQSVVELRSFLQTEPLSKAITIRFHPGANSLSAIICEPKSRDQGILVFAPKWALDADPGNRLYCVIERWEYEDLFNRLTGAIPAMIQSDSLSLEEACTELKV